MLDVLQSPAVALLVLAVLGLEAIILIVIWYRSHQGLRPAQTLAFLGAGAGFALCLYATMANLTPIWIGAFLLLAFVCHLADLTLRWKR